MNLIVGVKTLSYGHTSLNRIDHQDNIYLFASDMLASIIIILVQNWQRSSPGKGVVLDCYQCLMTAIVGVIVTCFLLNNENLI